MSRRIYMERERTILCVVLMFAAAFTAAILTLALLGSIKTQAAPAEPSFKYYTSIQLMEGDTLWSIADTYRTGEYESVQAYIDEVCSLNHIDANEIHAGQYLTIPYYSSTYLP